MQVAKEIPQAHPPGCPEEQTSGKAKLRRMDEEFRELVPPLTAEERRTLEENLLRDGCLDPLIVWDCATQGCFNLKKRPKIELFTDCLPGRIAFTDIDAVTEIQGNLLLVEWKERQHLATGQRILFERLTRFCPAAVLIVEGDAERMHVESIRLVWCGVIGPPEPMDLDALRREIQAWSLWAARNAALQREPEHEPGTMG